MSRLAITITATAFLLVAGAIFDCAAARDILDEPFIGFECAATSPQAVTYTVGDDATTYYPASVITAIQAGSQAEAAGLHPGDIILSISLTRQSLNMTEGMVQPSRPAAGKTDNFIDPTPREVAMLIRFGQQRHMPSAHIFIYNPSESYAFGSSDLFYPDYYSSYESAIVAGPQQEWLTHAAQEPPLLPSAPTAEPTSVERQMQVANAPVAAPTESTATANHWGSLTLRQKISDVLSESYSDAIADIRPAISSAMENPFFWTTLVLFPALLVLLGILVRQRGATSAAPARSLYEAVPPASQQPTNAPPPNPEGGSRPPTNAPGTALIIIENPSVPDIVPRPVIVQQDLPPSQPLALRLKRSESQSALGSIRYALDARIDVSAESRTLIIKHRLGGRLIYESADRQKHAERAQSHLAGSKSNVGFFAPAGQQAKGAAHTFWKLGRAAVSAARASLALRVTVDSLIAGVHVDCKSMEELLEAEDAFRQARDNLLAALETAQSFDGREEVY